MSCAAPGVQSLISGVILAPHTCLKNLSQEQIFHYRVSHLVVDLVWLTWNLIVPLPAQLCLRWWEFGRNALQLRKMAEHSTKSQPNPGNDQMGHSVQFLYNPCESALYSMNGEYNVTYQDNSRGKLRMCFFQPHSLYQTKRAQR